MQQTTPAHEVNSDHWATLALVNYRGNIIIFTAFFPAINTVLRRRVWNLNSGSGGPRFKPCSTLCFLRQGTLLHFVSIHLSV